MYKICENNETGTLSIPKGMHKNINDKTKFSKIKLDNVKDVFYK